MVMFSQAIVLGKVQNCLLCLTEKPEQLAT